MKTRTRMRELKGVFAGHRSMTHAHMARLSVLYEDLRIELTATAEASIPVLDITDERYRQNYFLRRCIATLVEFAETIRLLDECSEFQVVKASLDIDVRTVWDEGVHFFERQEQFFKDVRNDVGGHFGLKAALFALENLSPEAVGKIEARDDRTVHMHFAGELVATASLRRLQGSTNEHKFSRLLRTVVTGFHHATGCTHVVALGYLWERFGR